MDGRPERRLDSRDDNCISLDDTRLEGSVIQRIENYNLGTAAGGRLGTTTATPEREARDA